MSFCVNCETEVSQDEVISIFSVIDKREKTTVLNVISELFGVSHLRQFLQNCHCQNRHSGHKPIPRICKRCVTILKNSYKWRKQFLNVCHPEGTLGLILLDSDSSLRSLTQPKSRMKKCSVVIKRLPHNRDPLLTVIKTEPADFEVEYTDSHHNDLDDFSDQEASWSESDQWTKDVKPGTSPEYPHAGQSSSTRLTRHRQKFHCGQCFKTFSIRSIRDEHELGHQRDLLESEYREEQSSPNDLQDSDVDQLPSPIDAPDSDTEKEVIKTSKTGTFRVQTSWHSAKDFLCDLCAKVFHFKPELTSHLVHFHGLSNANYDVIGPDMSAHEENEMMDPNARKPRSKKPEKSKWKSEIWKSRRMMGSSYYSFIKRKDGKRQCVLREGRAMKPRCNSVLCKRSKERACLSISDADRLRIFNHYWKELNWKEKQTFVKDHVELLPVKRRTTSSFKIEQTYAYYLKVDEWESRRRVCSIMFLNTLGIGQKNMRTIVTDGYVKEVNRKSKYKAAQKVVDAHTYLDSLPKLTSLDCNCPESKSNDGKLYVEPLYKSKVYMYSAYQKYCKERKKAFISLSMFQTMVIRKKIAIFNSTKDDCDVCRAWKQRKSTLTEETESCMKPKTKH